MSLGEKRMNLPVIITVVHLGIREGYCRNAFYFCFLGLKKAPSFVAGVFFRGGGFISVLIRHTDPDGNFREGD